MPKVSVVISTYNRPELLKRAVDSVLAQSYQDFEIIVVHDGAHRAQFGSQGKITEIGLEENFGNDTRPKNLGIRVSKGEYVAFLDDDNTWRPDHLQVLVNAIEKDPRLDVVYGDRWINDTTKRIRDQIGIASDFNMGLLLQRNFIDTSDVLIKRQALFDVGGFDERYKKYIDWNLWIRMAKAGKLFKHVPIIITDYCLHKDMKSEKVKTDKEKGKEGFIPDWDPYSLEIELPYLGEIKEPRVAIFSLTYDRLELTKKCFESLYKTAGYEFTHFVVDNGSTDGTPEWIKKTQWDKRDITIIENKKNKGISIASNQAIDAIQRDGDYDIIVKVDNDAFFITPDWLKTMVKIWKSNHRLAMSPYVQGLRDNPGGAPRIGWGWIADEYLGMTKHIGGIVCFVDADAYREWRWGEEDFLHGVQDLEFSQYLVLNGFQLGYLENYFVEHCEGTEGQEKKFPEYFERRKIEKTKKYEKNE